MKIIPLIGIDNIIFGLTQSEVVNLLGEPSKIFTDEDEPNEIVCQYNRHKLSLTFYQDENDRLGNIRTSNPEVTFEGKRIINCPIKSVQSEVFSDTSEDWEVEYYDFFDTYFNEQYWLTVNVEYDEITEIEMGVPINSEDEYEWPAQE